MIEFIYIYCINNLILIEQQNEKNNSLLNGNGFVIK